MPIPLVTIRGQVIDSLTRAPVAGVNVGIGGKALWTDAEGFFTGQVAVGPTDIRVAALAFEPARVGVVVGPLDEFVVRLRRLAPIALDCEMGPGGFTAFIVDLQGRKSVERWTQSSMTLISPTSRRIIGARQWGYLPLDILRWRISIPDADPEVTQVDWVLYDNEGHLYQGSCEPLPVVPPDSTGT